MKLLTFALLILLAVSCDDDKKPEPSPQPTPTKPSEPTTEPTKPDNDSPTSTTKPDLSKAKKVSLWATMYYMKEVKSSSSGIPLRDMRDKVIGPKLDSKTWCLGAIEGTVRVDGITYNYAGTKSPAQTRCSHSPSSRVRWKVSKYEYGIGNRSNPLRPFKSLATDRSVIQSGCTVYIPEAVGIDYVFEGEWHKHDGVFYADDVGGKIKGNHIDVYIGAVKGGLSGALKINPFKFIKSNSSGTFEAYVYDCK